MFFYQFYAKIEKVSDENPSYNSPDMIYDFLIDFLHVNALPTEHVYCIHLNSSSKIIGYSLVSAGGLTTSHCDPRTILQQALLTNAAAIILVHNHPSGDHRPSQPDIEVTNRIQEACKIMQVTLLDHMVVGVDSYFSFKKEGLL